MSESEASKPTRRLGLGLFAVVLSSLLLAACGGSSSGSDSGSFQSLIQGLFSRTDDASDPIETNDLKLSFSEDPAQFQALLDAN